MSSYRSIKYPPQFLTNRGLFLANGTTTSITAGVNTKVNLVEVFDTDSWFASSRYTPQIPGYYYFSWKIGIEAGTGVCWRNGSQLFKNGATIDANSTFVNAQQDERNANIVASQLANEVVVSANGTTDYFEIYENPQFITATTGVVISSATGFSGYLLKGGFI